MAGFTLWHQYRCKSHFFVPSCMKDLHIFLPTASYCSRTMAFTGYTEFCITPCSTKRSTSHITSGSVSHPSNSLNIQWIDIQWLQYRHPLHHTRSTQWMDTSSLCRTISSYSCSLYIASYSSASSFLSTSGLSSCVLFIARTCISS
jgi:hypothetical protein